MLEKALILLFALAAIGVGVRSIVTRQARFSLSQRDRRNYGDESDSLIVEGWLSGCPCWLVRNRHRPVRPDQPPRALVAARRITAWRPTMISASSASSGSNSTSHRLAKTPVA